MKVQRLLAITMLLLGRRRVTGQELAEKFEVSLRTIYRDLETINAAGIPIASYSGADGGYEIMEKYRIDKQIVTADELGEIATALKGMRASFDDNGMDRLLDKVGALLSKSEQEKQAESGGTVLLNAGGLWTRRPLNRRAITSLRNASKEGQVVRFAYTKPEGATEERTAEPVGIVWKGYAWYLYAFCRERQDYRIFRLSRMRNIRLTGESFPRRDVTLEELDAQWAGSGGVSKVELVLRFEPKARIRVEEYFDESEISACEDGSLLVRAAQTENGWLYGMLLSYGTAVRILEPARIADIVKEEARRIFAMYE